MARYDPFDISRAFGYLRDGWVECRSEHAPVFQGQAERERAVATAKLRPRMSCAQISGAATARQLAKFFESPRDEEVQRPKIHQGGVDERRELIAAGDPGPTLACSPEAREAELHRDEACRCSDIQGADQAS
jgi:hypothetical protein